MLQLVSAHVDRPQPHSFRAQVGLGLWLLGRTVGLEGLSLMIAGIVAIIL